MSPVKGWGAVALVLVDAQSTKIVGIAGNQKPCNGIHYKLSGKQNDIYEAQEDDAPFLKKVSDNVFAFPVDER